MKKINLDIYYIYIITMLLKTVNPSKYYLPFFNETLKKYHFIENQDGFNMSSCRINDKEELYCVRYFGNLPAYFGEEIIPGNYSRQKAYITNKIGEKAAEKIAFGKNFIWSSWDELLSDNTIFL